MPTVLTTTAKIQCPHGFPITVTANASLTIGGVSVFGSPDFQQATPACTAPASQSSAPCTAISSVTAGPSAVLVVDGNAVILSSLQASTTGTPPTPLSVAPASSVVTAS